jgi:hypothetical protein
MHKKCKTWAKKSGAAFAPDKYQLIHLTRKRKGDVQAYVQIPGFNGKPTPLLRVLGIWLDPKLKWKQHIAKVTQGGMKHFAALTRIASSTWGLTFMKTRLLYTSTIRTALTHGGPIWGLGDQGQGLPENTLKPLQTLQNKCVRLIAGAYKRTPTAALQKETEIPPLSIYLQSLALNYAETTRTTSVQESIQARYKLIKNRLCTGIARKREILKTPQETLRENLLKEKQGQLHEKQASLGHETPDTNSQRQTQTQ